MVENVLNLNFVITGDVAGNSYQLNCRITGVLVSEKDKIYVVR